MIKFTKKEIEAIEILEAGNLKIADVQVRDWKNRVWFETGINTRVLRSLAQKGAVDMAYVLGGKVVDVEIIISSYAAKAAK
jgi:hypothetical protein